MIYLLDTNEIADWLIPPHHAKIDLAVERLFIQGHRVGICQPVRYEVLRGLRWKNLTDRLEMFNRRILPLLEGIELEDQDWVQAAHFWSDTHQRGYQIDDVDLLIAALAFRLNATVITEDNDFAVLPIRREKWGR